MFCKYCGKSIADDSSFCLYCGKAVNNKFEETKEYLQFKSNCESNFDLSDYEKRQNAYIKQQKIIQELEQTIVSDRKGMLILFVIALGLFGIGLQFGYNQHSFWCGFFVLASIGIFLIIGTIAEAKRKHKKDLKLARYNYQAYVDSKEEKKRLAQKLRTEAYLKNREIEKRKAECRSRGIACCPKCGSSSIATINRGFSVVSGFIGSGKPVNVCQMCGYKWEIGK